MLKKINLNADEINLLLDAIDTDIKDIETTDISKVVPEKIIYTTKINFQQQVKKLYVLRKRLCNLFD